MNNKARKQKGNRFENYLISRFREIDSEAKRNYASGAGLDKNDIRLPQYNIEVEAKNANTIHLTKDFHQLEQQTLDNTGILAIRNPKKAEFQQTFIVMDLEDFLEIMKEKTNYEVEQKLSPDFKWKLKRLKDTAHDLFKSL